MLVFLYFPTIICKHLFFLQNKTKILKHIFHILNIVGKYREFLYLYIILFYIATVSLVSIGTVYSYI